MKHDIVFLKCLQSYLAHMGRHVDLGELLSIRPIEAKVCSVNNMRRLVLQFGLELAETDMSHVCNRTIGEPILLRRNCGATRVVLASAQGGLLMTQPRVSEKPLVVPYATIMSDETAFVIRDARNRQKRSIFVKRARFWLLEWREDYRSNDLAALALLEKYVQENNINESEPDELVNLSCASLLESHKSIAPEHPIIYGLFRALNGRHPTRFADAGSVKPLLEKLLEIAAKFCSCTPEDRTVDVFDFASMVLSDYLTIHPFYNGNRRTSMVLISLVLRSVGQLICWENIGHSQFYYMVRCAALGHIGPMRAFLKSACTSVTLSKDETFCVSDSCRGADGMSVEYLSDRNVKWSTMSLRMREDIPPNVTHILSVLKSNGHQAFLVGGAVRDILLKRTPSDFDVVTSASSVEVFDMFECAHVVGGRFQVMLVETTGGTVQVSTFRTPHLDSKKMIREATVDWISALQEDAKSRDFTANAVYYDPITSVCIDVVNGLSDIRGRTLRSISSPSLSLKFDPVRAMRAIRLGAQLDFRLDRELVESLPIAKQCDIAQDRVRLAKELRGIFMSGNSKAAMEVMFNIGLLEHILPLLHRQMLDSSRRRFVNMCFDLADFDNRCGGTLSCSYFIAVLLWGNIMDGCGLDDVRPMRSLSLQLAADLEVGAQCGVLATMISDDASNVQRILGLQFQMDCDNLVYNIGFSRLSTWRDAAMFAHARRLSPLYGAARNASD